MWIPRLSFGHQLWIVAAITWASVTSRAAETAAFSSTVQEGPVRLAGDAVSNLGRWVPDLEFQSLDGTARRLSDFRGAPVLVIAFTSTTCPVTRRYASTLTTLEKEFAPRGVKFVFVNPIASDTVTEMREAIQAHGFSGPYVHDTQGTFAAALEARSTAEVFVLDAARTLKYRGAVDDQYGLGYSRETPRQTFLREAVLAVLASKGLEVEATSAPGCALEAPRAGAKASAPLTYHHRISRLLQRHCLECHHAGGNAPFTLESAADVAGHAGMIRKVVERGTMPPWFAEAEPAGRPSPWANDRRLPATDRADLLAWLEGGRPEGDTQASPTPTAYSGQWQIGTPDAVFALPKPIEVQASGRMPYQNVYVDTGLKEDRWVRALEVQPSARDVVHHVLVFVVPPTKESESAGATNSTARRRRSEDRGVGNFFAVYVPGNNVLRYRDGLAKHLPAGSQLHFQIHYTPKGMATRDQTRLGVLFTERPPQHEVRVAAIAPAQLRIPPGAANHETHGILPVPFEARLLSFMPHMHLRGKAYRYELEEPSGTRATLLEVPRYDFNWQLQYTLATPRSAPAGSRLHGWAWFDNSADNPANPDPARLVTWGEQTEDEMALGYLEYYVPGQTPGVRSPALASGGRGSGGLFATLDRNGDGVITRDESPTPQSFDQADADKDGKVTREELRAMMQRLRQVSPR